MPAMAASTLMLKASDGTMIYINDTGYLYPADNKRIDRKDPSWGGDRRVLFPHHSCVQHAHRAARLAYAHGDRLHHDYEAELAAAAKNSNDQAKQ